MKKVVGVILAVIFMAVIGWGAWYFTALSSVPAEKVLPSEPLVCIRFSQAQKYWNKLQQSPFGIRLGKVNLNLFLKNNPSLVPLTHTMEVLQNHFREPDVREYIRKFLGREVIIAVYQAEAADSMLSAGDSANQPLLPDVFFVSRVPSDIKFKELFMRFAPEKSRESGLQTTSYRDHVIYVLPVRDTGLKIAFARIGDVFIAGFSDTTLRRAIDVYGHVRPSLAADARFHWPSKGFGRADPALSVYWDMEKIVSLIAGVIRATQPPDPRVDDALQRIKGFTTAETSLSWDEMLTITHEMFFNSTQLSGDTKAYVEGCRPQNNQSLSFTPKDVLVYQWVGCADFGRYWQNVRKEALRLAQEKQPEGSSSEGSSEYALGEDAALEDAPGFETPLGGDLEDDVIAVLGPEIGWFANTGVQFLPLVGIKAPQVAIFVKINDPVEAGKVVSALLTKFSIEPEREINQGLQFNYFLTPLGPAVEPTFILLGDYFLIGSNRDILKEALYAAEDTRGALSASPSFQKTVKSPHEQTNQVGIFYVKPGELLESYGGLVNLAYQRISAGRETARTQAASAGTSVSGVDETKIAALNEELARRQKISAALEDEIWDISLKGQDTSAREEELKGQTEKIKSLQAQIQQAGENQTRLPLAEELSQPAPLHKPPDIDHASLLRRNVFDPVLDALKTIQAIGADVSLKKDRLSTEIQVQFEK